jgi:hypothetical protein
MAKKSPARAGLDEVDDLGAFNRKTTAGWSGMVKNQ